jgi:iron complex transport system substrate-binding protein
MSKFKIILFVAALALALTACGGTAAPPEAESSVTVVDGLGEEFTYEGRAERIVSVTLGTDEILLTLVGPERLIGVTYLATDPSISNAADLAADVANIVEADPEQIIALTPDLVFVETFTDPAVIDQIESAGIPVFVVGSLDSIDGVRGNILVLGQLTGDEARAQEMVDEMDAALDAITQALEGAGEAPLNVLYLAPDGWVAGSATTLDDIIVHAGGVNAAAEAGLESWQQVSEETILTLDPDVILVSSFMPVDDVLTNPVYADLTAVQNGRVYQANDVHLSAVSQYIVLGVQDVAAILYPDLFGG